MSAFHGNFFVRSTDLLSLPAVPMDQSYAIEIQIEDPISAPFVVFQTAVLHTTAYGERRIRVVTLALPTTSSISELYASVDQVALATLLANKAVERSNQAKLEDARDAVHNKLVDILGTYKATMTSSGSGASPQLVVAENMKFLPLLMLGLLKNVRRLSSSRPHSFFLHPVADAPLSASLADRHPAQHDDPVRRASLRSGPSHDPAVAAPHPVPAPCLLLAPQHAQRGASLLLLPLRAASRALTLSLATCVRSAAPSPSRVSSSLTLFRSRPNDLNGTACSSSRMARTSSFGSVATPSTSSSSTSSTCRRTPTCAAARCVSLSLSLSLLL